MAVTLSLFAGVGAQFFDNNGNILTGGKIYSYYAGTTSPLATYTTNAGNVAHTNPIILDSAGRVPSGGEIWLTNGIGYKFILKNSADVTVATYDNIPSSAQPPAANDADSIQYEQGYTVTAGSFVIGKTYRIVTVGTTNYQLIGATSNTVGLHFIATGVGSGTGTAELSQTVETKLRETVSVKDFGAVGDGVTPDDAAFAAAAAALASGQIQALSLPSGTYLLSSATRFDVNGAPGAISIIGDNQTSKVKFAAGTNARPFVIRNCTGVQISGIYFESVNSAVSCNCLDIMNCNDVTVDRCVFDGSTFYGLGIYQDTIGATDAACDNVIVRFNKFIDVGLIGLEQFPKVKSKVTEIYGNEFFNCGHNTLGLSGTAACMKPGQAYESAAVHDNIIHSCPAAGINIGNAESIDVYDNQIYDPKSYGLAITVSDHPYPYVAQFKQVSVRNNTIVYRTSFTTNDQTIVVNGLRTNNGPVVIEENQIFGGNQEAIRVVPTNAMPNIHIVRNEIYGNTSATPIRITNSVAGGATAGPVVAGNTVINYDLTKTAHRVEVTGASNPKIYGNQLVNMGNNAVILSSNTGTIIVEDNVIDGYNVANTANVAAINITDSLANTYWVRRNKILGGNGNPKAIYNGNNATPSVILDGNTADDESVSVTLNSTPNVLENAGHQFLQYGRRRVFYGAAVPIGGGVYNTGDIVWNTAPAASQPPGWVCVSGGSPGTWKAMANLAA